MDLQLNKRQKDILAALSGNAGLNRAEITEILLTNKKVSRPTVIRDLNDLLDHKLIKVKGKGRAVKYLLVQDNPLLEYIDLEEYFSQDLYSRNAKSDFDSEVFHNLASLFNTNEKALWEKSAKEFAERSQKLNPTIYKRELERFIIELSWKSSQIEGNTYTLLETETLIKQRIRAKGRTENEAIMILNHKSAFDKIVENRNNFKVLSLQSGESSFQSG